MDQFSIKIVILGFGLLYNSFMMILLIRHGQTQENVKGVMHRVGDPAGLSNLGEQQARALIAVCEQNRVEAIYTSPEVRARETARIIAEGMDKSYTVLEGFRERDWGQWEGKSWDEIKKALDPMDIEQRYTFVPPGGESWEQMDKRLMNSLNTILNEEKKVVAIVTHEGALRALVNTLNNSPKEDSLKLQFANGSVTIIEYRNAE
jgi:broad specificity phosphatase PhoE